MTTRRRYLAAYDIREPKRLRHVHRTMKGFGWAMQYSVFICDLDGVELFQLRERMADIIDHGVDSIAIIDVGVPGDRTRSSFSFMGVAPALPTSGPVIL